MGEEKKNKHTQDEPEHECLINNFQTRVEHSQSDEGRAEYQSPSQGKGRDETGDAPRTGEEDAAGEEGILRVVWMPDGAGGGGGGFHGDVYSRHI